MFISFSGIDGSGKTTHAKVLADNLRKMGYDILLVHGFKPKVYSKELIDIANLYSQDFHQLFSENVRMVSFILDLINLQKNVIIPALNNRRIVIAEKYFLDTIVYAPLLGGDEELVTIFSQIVLEPDVYILLDLNPEIACDRVRKRSESQQLLISPKEGIEIARKASKKFIENYRDFKDILIDTTLNKELNEKKIFHEVLNKIRNNGRLI